MIDRATFNWGDDYQEEYYDKNEKKTKNKREELEFIIFKIRTEIQNELINVFLSKEGYIILTYSFLRFGKLNEFSSILTELSDIEDKFLSMFEIATFNINMEDDNPTIYCSYERT